MPDTSALVVSLHNASLHVGGKALLRDITLKVSAGERVVVLGANGAGKSTLLKLICGIHTPTHGTQHSVARHERALIFQHPPILRRSALENIRFVLQYSGQTAHAPETFTTRAMAALDLAGLTHAAKQSAVTLSDGEQQRLALARAWAISPRLLLADEPSANLSPAATREIEATIRAIASTGATYVLTTHNLAQAKRLAQRIVFLDDGMIVEDRPALDFFAAPQSEAARRYLEGEVI